jgi:UDP-N-acetylmuramyl pentapeptide phosphotransferase/UDP-N-acetylglucosamine-1-phosphate transferase
MLVGTDSHFSVLTTGGAIAVVVVLGFAPFNYPRAVMFLGDVGSYFLGAWIAVLVVLGLRRGLPFEAIVAPVAIYLADTATTLARRVRMRERWWQPHRSHVYQRLTAMGWSHMFTTAFVAGAMLLSAMLGTLSLVASPVTRVVSDVAMVAVIVGYVTTPRRVTLRRERRGQEVALAR